MFEAFPELPIVLQESCARGPEPRYMDPSEVKLLVENHTWSELIGALDLIDIIYEGSDELLLHLCPVYLIEFLDDRESNVALDMHVLFHRLNSASLTQCQHQFILDYLVHLEAMDAYRLHVEGWRDAFLGKLDFMEGERPQE